MTTFTCAVGFFALTCAAPDVTPPAARFCKTYRPILLSRSDTVETRAQVAKANAKYRAVCGQR